MVGACSQPCLPDDHLRRRQVARTAHQTPPPHRPGRSRRLAVSRKGMGAKHGESIPNRNPKNRI